ncbi:LysR substrate-binding domain-containing protein [Parapusillimonas sp. JC17]|uniref:LysR substrate-binding domain-containing protein n=1 Tax=Parapusillimonas sp. JC17 TaxID=3445768 RepID=UPI003FA08C34
MQNVDIGLLRTLATIAKTGSFSDTAVHLCKTQSAITHQMHRLEELLGVTLFKKQGRARVLTEEGLRVVKYANQALAINDEIFRVFKHGQLQGTIYIGSPHDAVESLLPAILKYARSTLPQIKIKVCIERAPTLMEQLITGEIDLAISIRFDQDLQGLILRRSPTVWLCAADYVYDAKAPLPLVLADGVSIYRDMALTALEQSHTRWEIVQSVPNLVDIKTLVRAGLGVTPRCIDLLTPDMRVLGSKDGLPTLPDVTYHLCMRPHSANTLARQAYEQLKRDWKLIDVSELPGDA